MPLNIPAIASKLNDLAPPHPIGRLQHIRMELRNLRRRPGDKVFSKQTIFDRWAFHHGGRSELQFNIGYAGGESGDCLRYGVAFSFKLSQTLKSIDVLVPKVKYFNDFMALNAGDFSDMRMWHRDENGRGEDWPPGPIPSSLVTEGVFVFMGKRQPSKKIDYERILDDFDRLLPLYLYVETRGSTSPVSLPESGFNFTPGRSRKITRATATIPERELDLDLRHNRLQDALYQRLAAKHGIDNVATEHPSGVGTRIDIVVKVNENYWFYEIKTALTPRACLREAMGQLLEYGFWPGAHEPARIVVVGEKPIGEDGKEYLRRLRKRFSLPIEYETIVV